MLETKITIHFERFSLPARIYIYLLFLVGKYGKYTILEQKYKLVLKCSLKGNQKLDIIRKLFIVMNLLEISKVKTTY
jgi:hypothetical protein